MTKPYRNIGRLLCLGWLLAMLCCGSVSAAVSAKTSEQPAATAAAVDTVQSGQPAVVPAPLEVFNRTVTVFRAPYFGVAPADRAVRAKQEILRVLGKGGPGKVTVESSHQGRVILLDGELVFPIFPNDVDPLGGETLDQAAEKAVKELTHVVAETREARNVSTMFRAGGMALLATVILLLLVWGLHRIRVWVAARMLPLVQEKSSRLQVDGEVLFNGEFVLKGVTWLFAIFYWLVTLLLVYEWLVYSMGLFPYTRPWGERLMQYLLAVAGNIAGGMLTAIPQLLIAFLIFLIAKAVVNLLNSFFDRVRTGAIKLPWLDEDTVRPTRRLIAGHPVSSGRPPAA
jgi:hypothetical protein